MLETVGTPLLWAAFAVFVLAMVALDLGVFHRGRHEISVRDAAVWTASGSRWRSSSTAGCSGGSAPRPARRSSPAT